MITVPVFLHLGLNKIDLRLLSVALSHSELAGQLLINAVLVQVESAAKVAQALVRFPDLTGVSLRDQTSPRFERPY
jgi:hypothetical protein